MHYLDADAFNRYQTTGGLECPFCGSSELRWPGDAIFNDNATAYQEVICKDCSKEWRDHYTLQFVELYEPE